MATLLESSSMENKFNPMLTSLLNMNKPVRWYHGVNVIAFFLCLLSQVQTTTMCISVSLSGSVVLGCLFAPKIHIILFQPQKNVSTLRVATTRFSVTTGPGSSFSQGTVSFMISVLHHRQYNQSTAAVV